MARTLLLTLTSTNPRADTGVDAVRIRLQEPSLLDELIDALRNIGCTCEREGVDAFVVNYPVATDERERQLELNFFVRAWALRHGGVESVLAPSEASAQA
jgi:hypothetical protein